MAYGTPRSIQETILDAARSAPSDSVMTTCIRRLGSETPDRIPYTTLGQAAGRISGDEGRRIWKKGRCSVAQATVVAATCGDPDLLGEMAVKEKRKGPMAALCANPAVRLGTLVLAAREVSHYSSGEGSPTNLARRRLRTEELDAATIEECTRADQMLTVSALASRDDLTAERALELLQGVGGVHAVGTITSREDLPELGAEVLARLLERDGYGVLHALTGHARLLDLGPAVLERLTLSGMLPQLARRSDLPEDVRSMVVQRAAATRDLLTWRSILENVTFERSHLEGAPCHPSGGDLLGAVLAERFGDDAQAWDLALGLFETFLEKPLRELADTVEALRGRS